MTTVVADSVVTVGVVSLSSNFPISKRDMRPAFRLSSESAVLEVVVVEGYSMLEKWVTLWASSVKNVYLMNFGICEVR